MIRQEVAAACFRSRPRRPPQPKRFSVGPSRGRPPSIRPRRSPRTCPTTPADFRAPPNARPSNPHSPSPLAAAISAARGFLPRRLSDAGPSALASASVPGRRPKPLTIPAGRFAQIAAVPRTAGRRGHIDPLLPFEIGLVKGREAPESGLRLKARRANRRSRRWPVCRCPSISPSATVLCSTRRG
jgi:hypothetical protein